MSSCLTLKYPDEIYMCGDSAVSKIDKSTGEMIRVAGEDTQKIYQFGNYVVFASGIKQVIDPLLIELWKNKEKLSFQLISEKAKDAVNKFPEINKKLALELTVSTNEGGKLTSCVITSMHDCQVEFKDENKTLIMFNGCECEKLKEKFLKYCDIADSVKDLYLNIYREMEKEVEEIGGVLTVYKLDKNSISIIIKEKITPEKVFLHLSQDGSYVEFVPETTGLKWHKQAGDKGKDFHYLSYSGYQYTGYIASLEHKQYPVSLPDEFKGKEFIITVGIKELNGLPIPSFIQTITAFPASIDYDNAIVVFECYGRAWELDASNNPVACNLAISFTYTIVA